MSFAKAFGLSFVAFIGLNAVFFLIGYGIQGSLDLFFESLADTPSNISALLFGPLTGNFPSAIITTIVIWIGGLPVEIGFVILIVGYIIAPLIAAILSGKFGETKIQSFGGWFLTAIISTIVILVLGIVFAGGPMTPEMIATQVVTYLGIGIIYGLMFGCIALLVASSEY
ncbi:hypothetical protein LCGC14_1366140 [marine sediment metagenome]|uniref:Uncharacterized protein n=1 Tax=marine sediment metagenome TaxID=412755 RepID=A0A0F9N8T0_9ZZZZ